MDVKISLGIVTRNRPDHFRKALESVFRQDYRPLEVLVLDDASEPPLIPVTAPPGVEVRWWRYENNLGQLVGRNDLMRRARGEYYASLDDDAYFTDSQDLRRAAAYLDSHCEADVLTFQVISPKEAGGAVPSSSGRPQPTFTFMGGAHMLRKNLLPQIGFYREIFFRQGEEPDLSYRIWDSGHQIFSFPGVRVVHEMTPVARDWDLMARLTMRNSLLTIWLNQPLPLLPSSSFRMLAKAIIHHVTHRTLNQVFWPSMQGVFHAIKELPYIIKHRRPVAYQTIVKIFILRKFYSFP